MTMTVTMPSLYVHVPFCLQKCAYCAFYSMSLADQGSGEAKVHQYLTGIEHEIESRHSEAPSGVSSLFLGGGTPTALSPQQLERLLKLIHNKFSFKSKDKEKSLFIEKITEANPGTIEPEKLAILKDYGINRISLGAQSFHDDHLQLIGRIHTAEDIRRGVKLIRDAGFTNLNLDLMFGLPGQTMENWRDTVLKAVNLSPEHISIYGLTLEEGTPMGREYLENSLQPLYSKRNLPDDDLQADMYEWTVSYLQTQGYVHYEIANFAQSGFECRHNLAYWQGEEYIGLGPGAVSCLKGLRTMNIADIHIYERELASDSRGLDAEETEYLSLEQQISEYIMLGLRTTQGIKLKSFETKFQQNIQDIIGYKLANYIDRKVIILEDGRLRISPGYLFVANSILRNLIL